MVCIAEEKVDQNNFEDLFRSKCMELNMVVLQRLQRVHIDAVEDMNIFQNIHNLTGNGFVLKRARQAVFLEKEQISGTVCSGEGCVV